MHLVDKLTLVNTKSLGNSAVLICRWKTIQHKKRHKYMLFSSIKPRPKVKGKLKKQYPTVHSQTYDSSLSPLAPLHKGPSGSRMTPCRTFDSCTWPRHHTWQCRTTTGSTGATTRKLKIIFPVRRRHRREYTWSYETLIDLNWEVVYNELPETKRSLSNFESFQTTHLIMSGNTLAKNVFIYLSHVLFRIYLSFF